MTPSMWCPSARRVAVGTGSGSMRGGKPRAVHHTTEGPTIDGAIATYLKTHNYPTFTIDYAKDDVVQHLAADVAATAVQNPAGGVQTNREGAYCIQIEWIGQAAFPDWSKEKAGPNVLAFFDWLRSLGIPDVWPMGSPLPYPLSYGLGNSDRDPKVWTAIAGHYGHSQVPENHHGDPGAIDANFVRQSAKPHLELTTPTRTRLLELQSLLGVPKTGVIDAATLKLMGQRLIGWQSEVDARAKHPIALPGNSRPLLVKWLQQQGNRQHGYRYPVDGVVDKRLNNYIVSGLKQADAICGVAGFKAALV